MSTSTPTPLHTLARRGAGADDKFAEYKWFTIGTVLGLFALSFLGFAITELWGERIEKELGQRKLFKRMKAQGEEHKKNAQKKAYLADEYGVEEEDAELAFSTDKRAFKKIVEDSRRPRRS